MENRWILWNNRLKLWKNDRNYGKPDENHGNVRGKIGEQCKWQVAAPKFSKEQVFVPKVWQIATESAPCWKTIKGADNPTSQFLPIMSNKCCSGDGEGRKDKGCGGGSRSKTSYMWRFVRDKVVCERWCVAKEQGAGSQDAVQRHQSMSLTAVTAQNEKFIAG